MGFPEEKKSQPDFGVETIHNIRKQDHSTEKELTEIKLSMIEWIKPITFTNLYFQFMQDISAR